MPRIRDIDLGNDYNFYLKVFIFFALGLTVISIISNFNKYVIYASMLLSVIFHLYFLVWLSRRMNYFPLDRRRSLVLLTFAAVVLSLLGVNIGKFETLEPLGFLDQIKLSILYLFFGNICLDFLVTSVLALIKNTKSED